ncbi:hypothetical protein [Shimia marina]|uniref:Ada DNA repair metal-binding domain-containing protein n=1 Tax=Shimia marina TaxID=321267 RepID=A0A0P1FF94_9RHOB|nr:hypothetical protein [Shimia marina]CUH51962.1 hypothetical protein SHM7688_01402 [Shimia marina]SFE44487.1 hypothetical protein SAMN04488037_10975 [Shimia marina]
MPRQNRVMPTGEILRHPTRGTFMGNRGILHDREAHDHGALTHRRWRHKAWVCCLLTFKNRRRRLMAPNRYTELFFYDEAVALAAGHRPCAECRRADHAAFLAAAEHIGSTPDFDARLHAARAIPRKYHLRQSLQEVDDLPDGTFLMTASGPHLLLGDMALPFSPTGYAPPQKRPTGPHPVLTPKPTQIALRNGYHPKLHLPFAL